ncbi:hypothetical protein UA08_04482 [Talaromyces atroroseus]|uniref:DNA polymerase n=1 Tax=Talaromyces atroroseus TaxID=1441469 RepID=A0A225AFM8_TALAT|nr:hypothetical protein UA08_04482 [Talaromyces atroroseus]OKL60131.1 hypothetical protein UA08_04482 [Talaromyces atroroseus]
MTLNKSAFFRDLDSLDYVSDDGQHRPALAGTPFVRDSLDRAPISKLSGTSKLAHPSSVSEASANDTMTIHSSTGVNNLLEKHNESTTKRPAEAAPSGRPKACKKRRAMSLQSVPESNQIFKGLTFFFIPNNSIAPDRKLRIQRSQEYGASWAQAWSANITHVIVDRGLDYKEVLKVLTPDQLSGGVTLVNQHYISDCIGFGTILRVTQLRFRVDGNPATSASGAAPVESKTTSDGSLPIKGYRRRDKRALTPSQKEDTLTSNLASTTVQQEDGFRRSEQQKPDILDVLIQKVKAASDLPLDEPDYEVALDSAIEVGPSAGVSDGPENKSDDKVHEWQKSFTCMQKHDGTSISSNPNARTIETLQKMADYYDRTADNWRTMAYRKAITALKQQDTQICTKAQALGIRGIGQRLADKIEEIVSTDRLRRLENINSTPEDRSLQLFIGVYGAGFAQASKWVAKGYRSLEDLKTMAELTANQKIGVERYHDFQQRIPRAEVAVHANIVRAAVQAIDPDMEVIVAGSYRRGAADCGDIDVLITKNTGTLEYIRDLMIENVVPTLTQKGFLKVSLAATSRGDGSKWHGASALPDTEIWRRIDLLFVPGSEIGAALLYFTGNDIFNRSLRLLARKKGMRLNQRGLYKDVLRGAGQVKVTEGSLLEGQDEKHILEILGVPWRPPEHRIC